MSDVLDIHEITKSFGPYPVLRGVSFSIAKGSIYGLMGANGAGKSTLIKVLCGAHTPDDGTIGLAGEQVSFTSPREASLRGIGTVHQNPNDGVILDMSVAENLALDELTNPKGGIRFSFARTVKHARDVAATLGLEISRSAMRTPVRELNVSDRQLLVLARELSRQPTILILDEPTSALSAEETQRLFGLVRSLVDEKAMTVMYVSHKLPEFDQLCDRVGVLRDGVLQGEFEHQAGEGFDWPVVLQALFDRTPAEMARTELTGGDEVMKLTGVQVFTTSRPFDLSVRRGEVTVLLGLLGSGKTELLEWIFGARSALAGSISLSGKPFAPHHPQQAQARGVFLVPESRHEQGIIPEWSISAQMTLPFTKDFSVASVMNTRMERKGATAMMDTLGVIAQGPDAPIATLSGGNQQKVMIGRWLMRPPTILLLDEPFRGVDINARHDIGDTIRGLTESAAVLAATSDLDEALEVADRIVVIRAGELAGDFRISSTSRGELIAAMSGGSISGDDEVPDIAVVTDDEEKELP